jgi:hypothetical protein
VASLEARLEKLEQQRQRAAGEEIMRRARAASTDALSRFLLARELAEPEATFEEAEEQAWGCFGVPSALAQLANQRGAWGEELGDLLAARPGLLEHMYSRYPEASRQHFGEEDAKGVNPNHEKGGQ